MTTWTQFPIFASAALVAWSIAIVLVYNPKFDRWGKTFAFVGFAVLVAFTAQYWVSLGRPPLRTLGETRLWYALFLPPIGLLAEQRWQLRWMRVYTLLMSALFVALNLAMPETHDKSLAPALQSVWFVPHVIVYIVGYAFFGASSLVALHGLFLIWRKKAVRNALNSANTLAVLGFVCINLGLLFGAFWAKEAWGHYWTWDPKETWAFLTWLAYLVYIHITIRKQASATASFLTLTFGFAVLLVCWFGVNYLATASQSVHTYSN
jgi:ABC-type transport system involved in cytochrome c biogenesis permease subunit